MDSTQVCPPPWPQKTMGEEVMGAPLGRRLLCPAVNPGTAVQVQLRRLRLGGPALRSHSPEHGVGAPRSRRPPSDRTGWAWGRLLVHPGMATRAGGRKA